MAYKSDKFSLKRLTEKYQIPKFTLYQWIEKFEKEGVNGFEDSKTWKLYPEALKKVAVRDYLSGEFAQPEIVRKYDISIEASSKSG
jgi:transposase-like protein